MPKETPAAQEPAPRIGGVTTTARAARAAEEQPASEETLSMMPGLGDLAAELGIKGGKYAAAEEDSAAEETDEDPEDSADAGTEETAEEAEESAEETTEEEAAAPEETEEEAGEEEETPEGEEADVATVRAGMQKRIDKLTKARTELQTQVDELQAELETARAAAAPAAKPTAAQPLAHVATEAELATVAEEARAVKQWCLRNRNGGEVPGQDGAAARTYDADEVATMLANAEAQLDAVPARREWLGHEAAARELGRKLAPNFYQKGTPHQQYLAKVMATIPPAVKAWRPDLELLLVQAIVGSTVLNQSAPKEGASNPKPTVSVKKAPAAPGARVAPKAPVKQVQKQQQSKAFKQSSGSQRDLASMLESRISF